VVETHGRASLHARGYENIAFQAKTPNNLFFILQKEIFYCLY
jgi:hypothetical protein